MHKMQHCVTSLVTRKSYDYNETTSDIEIKKLPCQYQKNIEGKMPKR